MCRRLLKDRDHTSPTIPLLVSSDECVVFCHGRVRNCVRKLCRAALCSSLVHISAAVNRTADCDQERRCLISIPGQSEQSSPASYCTGEERRSTPEKVVIVHARHCLLKRSYHSVQYLYLPPNSCRWETVRDDTPIIRRTAEQREFIYHLAWNVPLPAKKLSMYVYRKNPPEPRLNLRPACNIFITLSLTKRPPPPSPPPSPTFRLCMAARICSSLTMSVAI
jgi:hypothetical protein